MLGKRIATILVIIVASVFIYIGYTYPYGIDDLVGDEVVRIQAEVKELSDENLVHTLGPMETTDPDNVAAIMDILDDYEYKKVMKMELGADLVLVKNGAEQKLLMYFTSDGRHKKFQFSDKGTIIMGKTEYQIGVFDKETVEILRLDLIKKLTLIQQENQN